MPTLLCLTLFFFVCTMILGLDRYMGDGDGLTANLPAETTLAANSRCYPRSCQGIHVARNALRLHVVSSQTRTSSALISSDVSNKTSVLWKDIWCHGHWTGRQQAGRAGGEGESQGPRLREVVAYSSSMCNSAEVGAVKNGNPPPGCLMHMPKNSFRGAVWILRYWLAN